MAGRVGRRAVLGLGLAAAGFRPAFAADAPAPLSFEIWRGSSRIGAHRVEFSRSGETITARILATMRIALGPVPLLAYRHEATETWSGGGFVALRSRTTTNGKLETVDARREEGAVIVSANGRPPAVLPASAAPLTHWNRDAIVRPLFNPQTGAPLRCTLSRRPPEPVRTADGRPLAAAPFVLTGEVQLTDWYDEAGVWAALAARAQDGSVVEYRRR